MDINSLIETMTTALAADSGLSDWAAAEYGTGHAVYENIDLREPPKDCPLIVARPATKTGGLNNDTKNHLLVFGVLVHDDARPVDVNGVKRFNGCRRAEEMRQLAFSVIKASVPDELKIEDIETEYDPVGQFPYIFVNMTVLFVEEKVIGTDPFE